MAAPTPVKKVWKDDRSFVLSAYAAWTDATNYSDQLILDASVDLGASVTEVIIDRVEVNTAVLTSVLVEFEATADVPLLYVANLAGTAIDVRRDFESNSSKEVKIRPRSSTEAGAIGDISITTTGAANPAYLSIVISGYYK